MDRIEIQVLYRYLAEQRNLDPGVAHLILDRILAKLNANHDAGSGLPSGEGRKEDKQDEML